MNNLRHTILCEKLQNMSQNIKLPINSSSILHSGFMNVTVAIDILTDNKNSIPILI